MVTARPTPEAKAALVRQHLDDGVPLTQLAESAGVPVRPVRRWAASYRADPTVASGGRAPTAADVGCPTT